jgi:hypothetical protein
MDPKDSLARASGWSSFVGMAAVLFLRRSSESIKFSAGVVEWTMLDPDRMFVGVR